MYKEALLGNTEVQGNSKLDGVMYEIYTSTI